MKIVYRNKKLYAQVNKKTHILRRPMEKVHATLTLAACVYAKNTKTGYVHEA